VEKARNKRPEGGESIKRPLAEKRGSFPEREKR